MKAKRYPLTRTAEMYLAYAECTNPHFHDVLGHAIEFERLPSEDAQHLVGAAQEIARNSGTPCASAVAAIQQLRLRVNAGRLTMESLQECSDLLLAVEDAGGVTDLDGLINTVAPAIRSIATLDALEQTIQGVGQGADPADAADRFAAVAQLGKARVSLGSDLQVTAEQIKRAATSTVMDPRPTGIPELDTLLGGGIERSSLAVFLANSGDGKTLALCHVATQAILDGHHTAYVSAELSEDNVKQRIFANLSNMSAQEMALDPDKAAQRISSLEATLPHPMAGLRVLYVTPKVGTVAQIRQWLRDLKKAHGFEPEVLIVDYADKLAAQARGGDGTKGGSYVEQGAVYQQLRDLIIELKLWGWTASQTTGRQGRKKKLDIEDIADSMEKARICDTLVVIMRNDEDVQSGLVRFRLPKRRNGEAHGEVGPIAMDAEHGRMVTICREEPW